MTLAQANSSDTTINLSQKLLIGANSSNTVADLYNEPADLVNRLVPILMIAAGMIVFVLIIYGGFKFIQDDQKGPQEAKKIWTIAVTGLIVMFSAYWIVQIIKILTDTDIRL